MKFKKRGLYWLPFPWFWGVGAALVAKNMIAGADHGRTTKTNTSQVATAAMTIPYGTKIEARARENGFDARQRRASRRDHGTRRS